MSKLEIMWNLAECGEHYTLSLAYDTTFDAVTSPA